MLTDDDLLLAAECVQETDVALGRKQFKRKKTAA